MAPININLVYLITVTFSFKLNLTFPYRKNTKLLSHKQPSRSSRILTIIYLILLITNNNNCGKNDQYFQHKEYNVPFSDDNIFDIFSSEPIHKSQSNSCQQCANTPLQIYKLRTNINKIQQDPCH